MCSSTLLVLKDLKKTTLSAEQGTGKAQSKVSASSQVEFKVANNSRLKENAQNSGYEKYTSH